jgi:hypothetical protein
MNREFKNYQIQPSIVAAILTLGLLTSILSCRGKNEAPRQPAGAAAKDAAASERPVPRKDAYFGLHFDLHPNRSDTVLGVDITEENIAALLDRVQPDYVQYDCKGHPGYAGYPTKIGWPSPGIVRDSLAIWRKVTKHRRVGLFIHYSGVWDSKAIEEHPDWARLDAQGRRDPNATSVFGPYADELMIPQLKEVTAAYDLDGVWVDALHAFNAKLQLTSNWMYTSFAAKPVVAGLDFLSGDYSPSLSIDRARVEARYLASTGMPWDLMAWGFDRGKDQNWSLKTPIHLM